MSKTLQSAMEQPHSGMTIQNPYGKQLGISYPVFRMETWVYDAVHVQVQIVKPFFGWLGEKNTKVFIS